jgi:hypothetical protein
MAAESARILPVREFLPPWGQRHAANHMPAEDMVLVRVAYGEQGLRAKLKALAQSGGRNPGYGSFPGA